MDLNANNKGNNRISEAEAQKFELDNYTYTDYLKWPEGKRCELIKGTVYNMVPAPSRRHQKVCGELLRVIANFLKGKTCEIYVAPFDVRLPEGNERDEEISTVVQPDLTVICDPAKLDEKGCRGAPDLIIEIVSPQSRERDRKIKRDLYEQKGVKEYWIVDYNEETVAVYISDEGKYGKPIVYADEDIITVNCLPDLKIDLAEVFSE